MIAAVIILIVVTGAVSKPQVTTLALGEVDKLLNNDSVVVQIWVDSCGDGDVGVLRSHASECKTWKKLLVVSANPRLGTSTVYGLESLKSTNKFSTPLKLGKHCNTWSNTEFCVPLEDVYGPQMIPGPVKFKYEKKWLNKKIYKKMHARMYYFYQSEAESLSKKCFAKQHSSNEKIYNISSSSTYAIKIGDTTESCLKSETMTAPKNSSAVFVPTIHEGGYNQEDIDNVVESSQICYVFLYGSIMTSTRPCMETLATTNAYDGFRVSTTGMFHDTADDIKNMTSRHSIYVYLILSGIIVFLSMFLGLMLCAYRSCRRQRLTARAESIVTFTSRPTAYFKTLPGNVAQALGEQNSGTIQSFKVEASVVEKMRVMLIYTKEIGSAYNASVSIIEKLEEKRTLIPHISNKCPPSVLDWSVLNKIYFKDSYIPFKSGVDGLIWLTSPLTESEITTLNQDHAICKNAFDRSLKLSNIQQFLCVVINITTQCAREGVVTSSVAQNMLKLQRFLDVDVRKSLELRMKNDRWQPYLDGLRLSIASSIEKTGEKGTYRIPRKDQTKERLIPNKMINLDV